MGKIKYINFYGTSSTAGGGFEFDSPSEGPFIYIRYDKCNEEPKTQFNYSFPGQLKKFIDKTDIEVFNFGKQGYGNDRMMRLAYARTKEEKFNKDEHLFLFEFAALGRDEFYFNEIKDYIICNYSIENDRAIYGSAANSYKHDTIELEDKLISYDDFFKTYYTNFIDIKDQVDKVIRDSEFFISYLDRLGINYYFTIPPSCVVDYDSSKEIVFGDGKYFKKSNDVIDFSVKNKLTIKDETNNSVTDMHSGIKANKLMGHIIYNRLVEDGWLDNKIIPIDWKYYKETDFLKK